MSDLAARQYTEWLVAVQKLGRAPPEWVGKTPDAMPPGRVRDRILRTWGAICYLSGLPIVGPFEIEHIIPLSMGGMNAERNLHPVLAAEHRKKTRCEAKERAKADRARRAANGTKTAPTKKIQSAPFPVAEKESKRRPVEKLAGLGPSNLARRFT